MGQVSMGYSPVIRSKAYRISKKIRWIFLWAAILSGIIGLYFLVQLEFNLRDIPRPYLIQILIVAGIMLVSITAAVLKTLGETRHGRAWEATVVGKHAEWREVYEYDTVAQRKIKEKKIFLLLDVVMRNGKQQALVCDEGMHQYYQEGDRIKRHRGYDFWEKYDKTRDSEIICINCGKFTPIRKEKCGFCKLPLLK